MKRYNPRGKATKEERAWMDRVAQERCCGCGAHQIQVHHVTEGFRRLGNFYCFALCLTCHPLVDAKGFQWELEQCRQTHKRLGRKFTEPPTKIVPRRALRILTDEEDLQAD